MRRSRRGKECDGRQKRGGELHDDGDGVCILNFWLRLEGRMSVQRIESGPREIFIPFPRFQQQCLRRRTTSLHKTKNLRDPGSLPLLPSVQILEPGPTVATE